MTTPNRTDDRRVIVVGSGPSGAMAALTLIEQGVPVTMLESGLRMPSGVLVRAGGKNLLRRPPKVGDPGRHTASDDPEAFWRHALVPGGLSNHWAGAVPRFAPDDFTEGERLHERYRWPVTYADLAPHYERVERLLDVVGTGHAVPNLPANSITYEHELPEDWRRVARHAEAFGHGLTSLPVAAGPAWALRRTGVGFNSFTRIVQRLQRSPLFRLILGAHALRVEYGGDTRRARSVVYFDRTTRSEERIAGAAVVVAAGPLASTKLLLDSTSADFPAGLGDTEGILGHYLHDHPHDIATLELDAKLHRLGHSAYVTRAPYAESTPLQAAQFAVGSASSVEKLLSLTPMKSNRFGIWCFGTMVPEHANYAGPHPTLKDEFGYPRLDVHIHFGKDTLRNMATAQDRLIEILAAAGYRGAIRSSQPRLVPGVSMHYGGSVRMHASPKHGMLNGWGRLHAVDNVVVADASVFTTGPEKNPTLTVMALADRAAERLAEDLKRG